LLVVASLFPILTSSGCASRRNELPPIPGKPELIEVEVPRDTPCPIIVPALDLPAGSTTDDVEARQHAYILKLRRYLACWIRGAPVPD
jgi:hypothetical protein